jgi:hypothetical protein
MADTISIRRFPGFRLSPARRDWDFCGAAMPDPGFHRWDDVYESTFMKKAV